LRWRLLRFVTLRYRHVPLHFVCVLLFVVRCWLSLPTFVAFSPHAFNAFWFSSHKTPHTRLHVAFTCVWFLDTLPVATFGWLRADVSLAPFIRSVDSAVVTARCYTFCSYGWLRCGWLVHYTISRPSFATLFGHCVRVYGCFRFVHTFLLAYARLHRTRTFLHTHIALFTLYTFRFGFTVAFFGWLRTPRLFHTFTGWFSGFGLRCSAFSFVPAGFRSRFYARFGFTRLRSLVSRLRLHTRLRSRLRVFGALRYGYRFYVVWLWFCVYVCVYVLLFVGLLGYLPRSTVPFTVLVCVLLPHTSLLRCAFGFISRSVPVGYVLYIFVHSTFHVYLPTFIRWLFVGFLIYVVAWVPVTRGVPRTRFTVRSTGSDLVYQFGSSSRTTTA